MNVDIYLNIVVLVFIGKLLLSTNVLRYQEFSALLQDFILTVLANSSNRVNNTHSIIWNVTFYKLWVPQMAKG